MSILCKLECEGFTENSNDETNNSFHIYIPTEAEGCAEIDLCAEECSDDDVASEVDKLTERVWNLETSVTDIKGMVKSMFDTLVQKKQTKRASLRKSSR